MQRLDKDLEFFVAKKIKEDAAWRSLTIIYSGIFSLSFSLFFFSSSFPTKPF